MSALLSAGLGPDMLYYWPSLKEGGMLRVTVKKEDLAETWELEGSLSGQWVPELDRLWRQRTPPSGGTVEIHLKAVSYIDPAGKQLLAEMRQQGAGIKGCGCMVRAFVEEIMGKKASAETGALPKKILTVVLLTGLLFGGASILCANHRPPVGREIQGPAAEAHR
jgi:ABC-type transporter Mla MlaB component